MGRATAGALGLAVAMTVAATPYAWAADWNVAPTLTIGIDNDSNRLLLSPAIPSRGLSMSLDTHFELDTERFKLTLRPNGQAERYTDPRLNPTSEGGLDVTATWAATERSSFTLHAQLQEGSTLYSEQLDTGLIHIGQRRTDKDADGSWSFEQTERWTLQLGGSYSGSDYHGAGASELSNFRQALGTASESYLFTEQVTLSLNGSAGDAKTAGAEQSTRFKSLGAGIQWHPTERISIQGSAGVSRQTTGALTSTTVIGQLGASYATELSNFTFSAERELQPSGFGVFTQVDQGSFAATRALSERLSLTWEGQIYRDTSAFHSPFISFSYADRTYSESHLRLEWQQTPAWTLALQLEYDSAYNPVSYLIPAGLDAHAWMVSVQSVWAPHGASVSR
jgi:hypothetical protein